MILDGNSGYTLLSDEVREAFCIPPEEASTSTSQEDNNDEETEYVFETDHDNEDNGKMEYLFFFHVPGN